jgi:hypothetical protein
VAEGERRETKSDGLVLFPSTSIEKLQSVRTSGTPIFVDRGVTVRYAPSAPKSWTCPKILFSTSFSAVEGF